MRNEGYCESERSQIVRAGIFFIKTDAPCCHQTSSIEALKVNII